MGRMRAVLVDLQRRLLNRSSQILNRNFHHCPKRHVVKLYLYAHEKQNVHSTDLPYKTYFVFVDREYN